MTGLKLGKRPATADHRDLLLTSYLDLAALPPIPAAFGHQALFGPKGWSMLGNDSYGDCVWAGAAHETMLWSKLGGHPATFSNHAVLSDYSACTGFNENDPSTDNGTDMRVAAGYRRSAGVVDAHGTRHKIAAYVAVAPGHLSQLAAAMFLFDAVGIGIQFPSSAMEQFNNGQPWDVVPGATIEGGHYITGACRLKNGNYGIVTWGQLHEATPRFLTTYMDEAFAYLSLEVLTAAKSPEGFNVTQLRADLSAVK